MEEPVHLDSKESRSENKIVEEPILVESKASQTEKYINMVLKKEEVNKSEG